MLLLFCKANALFLTAEKYSVSLGLCVILSLPVMEKRGMHNYLLLFG